MSATKQMGVFQRSGERLIFSAAVEIKAEPAEVFAVVSDLRRKALLNPNIQVIRVELEGEDPVREGSVFYHRFQRGTRILEYRSRCVRLMPPWLFESRSETDPPFEVRVTVHPTPAGCMLAQQENIEVTPELLDAFDPVRPNWLAFAILWRCSRFSPALVRSDLSSEPFSVSALSEASLANYNPGWMPFGHI